MASRMRTIERMSKTMLVDLDNIVPVKTMKNSPGFMGEGDEGKKLDATAVEGKLRAQLISNGVTKYITNAVLQSLSQEIAKSENEEAAGGKIRRVAAAIAVLSAPGKDIRISTVLSLPGACATLAANPEAVATAMGSMNYSAYELAGALKNKSFSGWLLSDPVKNTGILQELAEKHTSLLEALSNKDVADWFVADWKKAEKILDAFNAGAGEQGSLAIGALSNPSLGKWFVSNPKQAAADFAAFCKLLEGKGDIYYLLGTLKCKEIGEWFLSDQKGLAGALASFTVELGYGSLQILKNGIGSAFAADSEKLKTSLRSLLESFGNRDKGDVMDVLERKSISDWFAKNPALAIEKLSKLDDIEWIDAFSSFFGNEIHCKDFVAKPDMYLQFFEKKHNPQYSWKMDSYTFQSAIELLSQDAVADYSVQHQGQTGDDIFILARDKNAPAVLSYLSDNDGTLFAANMSHFTKLSLMLEHDVSQLVRAITEAKKPDIGAISEAISSVYNGPDRIDGYFQLFAAPEFAKVFVDDPAGTISSLRQLVRAAVQNTSMNDYGVPREVLGAIAKNPSAYFENKAAYQQIADASGKKCAGIFSLLAERADVLDYFKKNTEAAQAYFGRIASIKFTDDSMFDLLKKDSVAALFLSDPERLVGALERIGAAAAKKTYEAFDALKDYAGRGGGAFSFEILQGFARIAEISGTASTEAFRAYSNPAVRQYIKDKPQEAENFFKKLISDGNQGALELLANDETARMLASDPKRLAAVFDHIGKTSSPASFGVLVHDAMDDFAKNLDAYVLISEAAGKAAEGAFYLYSNRPGVKAAFSEDSTTMLDIFRRISVAGKGTASETFANITKIEPKVSGADGNAAPSPTPSRLLESCARLTEACGELTPRMLDVIYGLNMAQNRGLPEYFESNPDKVISAAAQAIKYFGATSEAALSALTDSDKNVFLDFCQGKMTLTGLGFAVMSSYSYAIELGRPLDDLHENQPEREKYLASLSSDQVLSLVLSDPALFYTSSNNMLFDRLKKDLNGKPLESLLMEKGVQGGELERNLIFRAMNYDRFLGASNAIFTKSEMPSAIPVLLAPLADKEFDKTYFYLLVNNIDQLKNDFGVDILQKLRALKSEPDVAREKAAAADFIMDYMKNPKKYSTEFDASKYREAIEGGKQGKMVIVQVFDKQDTGKDHWVLTQEWFAKKLPKGADGTPGQPQKGADGELIYETKDAKVILFMGEDDAKNREFVKKRMETSPSMVLTFRGHSFSLEGNMPKDIFENKSADLLFIPGSCGSAGAIPGYIYSNPETRMDFISNSSTGYGQVTNAVLDIMISEAAKARRTGINREYSKILSDPVNVALIERNGGDPATLKAPTIGEKMLEAVYRGLSKLT